MYLAFCSYEQLNEDGRLTSYLLLPKDESVLVTDRLSDVSGPPNPGDIDLGPLRIYARGVGVQFRRLSSQLSARLFECNGNDLRFQIEHTDMPLPPNRAGFYALLLPEDFCGQVSLPDNSEAYYLKDKRRMLVSVGFQRYADQANKPRIRLSGQLTRGAIPREGIKVVASFEAFRDGLHGLHHSQIRSLLRAVNRGLHQDAPSVFICHSSGDKPFAQQLATALAGQGVRVWLDEAQIRVGDSLIGKIEAGIINSHCLIAVLSKRSVTSPWCKEELRMAMAMQIGSETIRVLPALLDDCERPGFLKEKVYADFTSEYRFDESVADLMDAIYGRV